MSTIRFSDILAEGCHKVDDHTWEVTTKAGSKVGTASTSEACKRMSKSVNGVTKHHKKSHKKKAHKKKV